MIHPAFDLCPWAKDQSFTACIMKSTVAECLSNIKPEVHPNLPYSRQWNPTSNYIYGKLEKLGRQKPWGPSPRNSWRRRWTLKLGLLLPPSTSAKYPLMKPASHWGSLDCKIDRVGQLYESFFTFELNEGPGSAHAIGHEIYVTNTLSSFYSGICIHGFLICFFFFLLLLFFFWMWWKTIQVMDFLNN